MLKTSYVAGLFDGEGSVCMYRTGQHERPYYYLTVSIYNSDLSVIEQIQEQFNGLISTDRRNTKPVYALTFTGSTMVNFLEEMVKEVWIKREQIEAALEYLDLFKSGANLGTIRLSDEQRVLRERCYKRLQILKRNHD